MASLPMRAEKRRIGSLCNISPPERPVQAESPFCIALATSLDQRSPQRLLVTSALSAKPTSRPISLARSVMRPCTSPVRNTVCAAPPLPAPRWLWRRVGQVAVYAAGNAAKRLAPADDAGNGLFVDAVLQRHDEAVRRQIRPDQHGG